MDAKGEPEGNWYAAGGSDWPRARRTEVVKAYSAVELQSPDPRGLAERWGSIAEIPLREDKRGRLEMPLDNASVRCVEARDGRPEGLVDGSVRPALQEVMTSEVGVLRTAESIVPSVEGIAATAKAGSTDLDAAPPLLTTRQPVTATVAGVANSRGTPHGTDRRFRGAPGCRS